MKIASRIELTWNRQRLNGFRWVFARAFLSSSVTNTCVHVEHSIAFVAYFVYFPKLLASTCVLFHKAIILGASLWLYFPLASE